MSIAQQITEGRCAQPFAELGWIQDKKKAHIKIWFENALSISIVDAKDKHNIADLQKDEHGIFCATLNGKNATYTLYEVVAQTPQGEYRYYDPYQFKDTAYHAVHFIDHQPENLYLQAGAQLMSTPQGIEGVRFTVFAPNASAMSLMGNFNHWDKRSHPMEKTDLGYWVLFVPGLKAGEQYKFALKDAHGNTLPDKSDPLAFSQHQYPSHASVVYDHNAYQWQHSEPKAKNLYHEPMSIYEVHLGSWRRPQTQARYLTYRELAEDLVSYVKYMGYTHIEVLPVSEFPFDGSWGYQPVGLFAPTSRFGDPDDFKYFVDTCHKHNIGVIIDWVPAHFPEDGHGLARFDGTHVYEYEDPRKGWHPDWNSCIYDFGKQTVRQFLVANALYWFDKFKVDGIRVDAVASMLYLDYSRNDGEWIPNIDGGNHNYEAISLLQWMNTEVYAKFPHAVTIAEESTSFAGVSRPVNNGGLGFGFKWNMGWMHDSLHYIAKDPAYRRYHHCELTFSMVYAFDENFVLPISHDEVVHGKGAMIQKMPGDEWQRFANLRAYYGFMFGHPGKKLQFMGNEFAQSVEWNHDAQLNWEQSDYPNHKGIQLLYKDLNTLYTSEPSLHELDHNNEGFRWIDLHNAEQSIVSFIRFAQNKVAPVLVICNFTPSVHHRMRIGVPEKGRFSLILNTDDPKYAGSGFALEQQYTSEDIAFHGCTQSIEINIPPLATVFLKHLTK
ncbi:1,4-alpha-glucan branching protein GlgB [Glaciecola sp. 2405UD65-10]|uniref:1,4-alpha-glucan branching protein GlgB n=1 Tax=Glaciecola sp. 2405UD65-10 TaxID=3397244 RepID=UPI003B592267